MEQIKTTCPYCGVGCGIIAERDGADIKISGDPEHPANFGRLCSKGYALGETLDLDNRLLHPQVDGRLTGWDTALDTVASRLQAIIAEHGPDAVGFYVSGQLLTEDYYSARGCAGPPWSAATAKAWRKTKRVCQKGSGPANRASWD